MVFASSSYGTAPENQNGMNAVNVLTDVPLLQKLKQSDIIDHNNLEAKYALSSFSETEIANEVHQSSAVISPHSKADQITEQDNVSNTSQEVSRSLMILALLLNPVQCSFLGLGLLDLPF